MYYRMLDNGDVVKEKDQVKAFGPYINRKVARTQFTDGSFLSSAFLVVDHVFSSGLDPILFETMYFDRNEKGVIVHRSRSALEARDIHIKIVDELKQDGLIVAEHTEMQLG